MYNYEVLQTSERSRRHTSSMSQVRLAPFNVAKSKCLVTESPKLIEMRLLWELYILMMPSNSSTLPSWRSFPATVYAVPIGNTCHFSTCHNRLNALLCKAITSPRVHSLQRAGIDLPLDLVLEVVELLVEVWQSLLARFTRAIVTA